MQCLVSVDDIKALRCRLESILAASGQHLYVTWTFFVVE